jgi:putative ABC transport system ATP-binding protein
MALQVELKSVTKRFAEPGGGERTVLDGVDLECEDRSVTILEGRSGSGKSTLLNLISGLLVPDGGEVLVGGDSLGRLSESRRDRFRAKNVGYVFQTFNLISPLTVLENVYVPEALAGNASVGDRDRARQILDDLGLGDHAHKLPFHLSVGQRQRVAVARAALRRPKILLADEPTANLDERSAEVVLETLLGLRESGSTLIVASHDPLIKQVEGATTFDLETGEVRG